MKTLPILALLAILAPIIASAADKSASVNSDEFTWAAAKSVEIETMRLRIGTSPSVNATTTLIETEDLLRRFKAAPPSQKNALRAQIDAAAARLELEAAGQNR